MSRTLYLHIGAHRTATTSTQGFLFQNSDALFEKGYLYPFRVRRHLQLMNGIFSGATRVPDVISSLEGRIAKRTGPRGPDIRAIVLSDEDICMREDLAPLAAFRERYDVKVVFTLRRQDIWLESWYFQNIKWQWNPSLAHITFDEFMARSEEFHWIDYARYVAHLEKVFGAENLRLHVFEPAQMPDGPVAAFCRQIGLEDIDGLKTPSHANASRSPQMAEFMRLLPLDQAPTDVRALLTRACEHVDRDVLGNTGKQSERLMPPDLRRQVMARYADGNAAIASRYFDRDALFLEPLPPEDTPLARMTLPGDPEELMRLFVAPLMARMIETGQISKPSPPAAGGKEPVTAREGRGG